MKFLESCVAREGEDVHFECLVSHEDAPSAQWRLKDFPLQNNGVNVIKIECCTHSLTLRGVTTADSGTVTFSVGNHTSTASLTVIGKEILNCSSHLHPYLKFQIHVFFFFNPSFILNSGGYSWNMLLLSFSLFPFL